MAGASRRSRRNDVDDDQDDATEVPGVHQEEEEVALDEEQVPALNRALLIHEGRKAIQETQQRIRLLEKEHCKHVQRASLLVNAEHAWGYMGYRERRNPTNIMLALQSPKHPSCMKWENFDHNFPHKVQQNKQILLARLKYVPGFGERYETTIFDVPRTLRGDKELMMEVCARSPHSLQVACKTLKEDRQLCMVAITKDPCALLHASPKLRGDRRIARAVLARPNGIRAFKYLSRKLQDDPKLALFAIRKCGEEYSGFHLEDLPNHFAGDEDVVAEAVRHRGGNLRFVTDKSLLTDFEIVYQALSNDGTALEFVPPGSTRNAMLQGNNLMTVLCNGGGQFLSEANEVYKQDREFVLAAVENGYADASLAKFFDSDKEFFFALIMGSTKIDNLYLCLPDMVRNEKDVVRALLKNASISVGRIRSIVSHNEFLLREKEVLLDAIRRGCLSVLGPKMVPDLMGDREFVLQACAIDGSCLEHASTELRKEEEVIERAFLTSKKPISIDALVHALPVEVWQNESFVENIIRGMPNTDEYCLKLIIDAVPNLRARNIYLACLEKGWPFKLLPYNPRVLFDEDEEIALATLKQQKAQGGTTFYQHLGPALRSRRQFLERAIEVDPCVLFYATESLQYDYQLMLRAIAASKSALLTSAHTANISQIVEFATRVREQKATADGFVVEFLRGVQAGPVTPFSPPKKRQRRGKKCMEEDPKRACSHNCHLPLLNCGAETGVALQRLIGEFVGVPFGREYHLLKKASENLEFWGY